MDGMNGLGRGTGTLSPLGEWLFGAVFWIAGLAIIALAIGWIPSPPERFQAPRWVVGVAGILFVAGGFAPMSVRLGPDSWASRAIGAAALLPLATVFNWIAFGSGPRSFSGGISVMGLAGLNGGVSESSGRVFFGIAAVLMDLMVIAMLVKWVRRRAP
jgi:hypothetical protein